MENFESKAIRGQIDRSQYREHSVPMYLTSSFMFDSAEQAVALFSDDEEGNIYSRYSNPNTTELIQKVCEMEGAEDGLATSSGMSAIFTSIAPFLSQGDHVLVCRSVFGSTHQILTNIFPNWGIEFTYADIDKTEEWESLIQPNTKMIFLETPSNPALDLIDLEWIGKLCKKHNILLNVDNCFATPYLQQPIKYGADIVMHSATKLMDGQGRVLGGLIVGKKELIAKMRFFARHTGPSMSPFNAWELSKSLETLAVRLDRHCENALKIAEYLENHEEVESVKYPFLKSHPQYELAKEQMTQGGSIVSFTIKGGLERGKKFLNAIENLSFTSNLGDCRTILNHPASTTHCKLTEEDRVRVGIYPGLIRVSVGLEHSDDIIAEIEKSIQASK
ncbi:MAG: PLP-dependent aspartate aminotransferase family protein [Cyclobacteriaceae bacterium]